MWNVESNLDKNQENPEEKAKRIEFDKEVLRTFNGHSGKNVLEYFKKNTIDSPTWYLGAENTMAIFREGQNSIIREILVRMENAKKEH